MKFSLIAAVSENNVIGHNNELPWPRISEDMAHFRRMTQGYPVIMGRLTWESLKCKALPRRRNYIVSTTMEPIDDPEVIVVRSLQEALDDISLSDAVPKRPFVIGGAQLYAEALKHPDLMWIDLTRVHVTALGDTQMPFIDPKHWEVIDSRAVYDGQTQIHMTRQRIRRR